MSSLITQNGHRYIYDGDGQLVVKINETTSERSIYLGSYAEVTYTAAAAATPAPSATLNPTVTRTPVPSRTSTLTPTKTATRITQTKTYTKTVVVQTLTPNRTRTTTPTATRTNTHTHTPSRTGTVTQTRTPTATATHTRTATPTPTSNPNLAGMAWKFYYLAGSERVAMRVIDGGSNQLYYLFTDHLGSTSEVRRADGSLHSQQYYMAFGEERYTYNTLPTDRTYTGQREIENGLVHYGARIYDPGLAQFLQADSINPDRYDPESWNKYSYVQYKPINSIDPTGHKEVECDSEGNCLDIRDLLAQYHRADDWQRAQLSFDEFVIGYGCYQYFMAHPEEALQNAMDDTDAYYYADTYSEYVLHAMFQPFDEGPVMVMAEQARISGDANTFWSAMLWLAVGYVFEGADKGFGGGSPQFTRLSKGEIKALKKAGIDIHLFKGTGKVSQYDLFKDGNGEIYIKPRSGIGPGEPLGINIKKILGK